MVTAQKNLNTSMATIVVVTQLRYKHVKVWSYKAIKRPKMISKPSSQCCVIVRHAIRHIEKDIKNNVRNSCCSTCKCGNNKRKYD